MKTMIKVTLPIQEYERLKLIENEYEKFEKSTTVYIEKHESGYRRVTTDEEATSLLANQLKYHVEMIEIKKQQIDELYEEFEIIKSKSVRSILLDRFKTFFKKH